MPLPAQTSSLVGLAANCSHDMAAALEAVQTLTSIFAVDQAARDEALRCNVCEALLDIVRYANASPEAVKAVLQCLDRLSSESRLEFSFDPRSHLYRCMRLLPLRAWWHGDGAERLP